MLVTTARRRSPLSMIPIVRARVQQSQQSQQQSCQQQFQQQSQL
jgi:hypothetical protein